METRRVGRVLLVVALSEEEENNKSGTRTRCIDRASKLGTPGK